MDDRLTAAPVLSRFAEQIRSTADVVAFYVGGSLAFGDYRPGISDLDVLAVVANRLDRTRLKRVTATHLAFNDADPTAFKLHCAYIPKDDVADLSRKHPYWAQGELYRRAVSGIARAEVLQNGIVAYGPPPAEVLPALDRAAIRTAALAELSGYWTKTAAKRKPWLNDWCVDLGLVTLARVEATITKDRFITKREAIERLDRFDVPAELAAQIARRRQGETITLTDAERKDRAQVARHLMIAGMSRLLAQG